MNKLFSTLTSVKFRRYLYGIAITAVPLLVTYGILDNGNSPLVLAVIVSVLGFSMATVNFSDNSQNSQNSQNITPGSPQQNEFDHEYYKNSDQYLG